MFLKNEDVKIGTIPDANGSDNPLKKMEFLTEKEMKDSSRLFGKVIVPPASALAYHTHDLLKTIGTSLIYLKIYEILVSSFQKYKFHQNQYLLKSSVTPLRSHRSGLHYVHLIQS